MALAGAVAKMPAPVTVTTVGQAPSEGWTSVHLFDGADLPSGDGDYIFVVFGSVGVPTYGSGRFAPIHTVIEVSMGIHFFPTPSVFSKFTHRQSLNGFASGSAGTVPFLFILDTASESPQAGLAANKFAVMARMARNGDEPARQFGASFEVSDATILCFDRQVIDADALHYNNYDFATEIGWAGGPSSTVQGFKQISPGGGSAFGENGETWLVFHSIESQPSMSTQSPHWVVTRTNGSAHTLTYGTYGSPAAGWHGLAARGRGHEATPANRGGWNSHALGAFQVMTFDQGGNRIGLVGREQHNNTGPLNGRLSWCHRFVTFAVRLDQLSFVHSYPVDSPVPKLFRRGFSGPPGEVEREFINGHYSDYTILATAMRVPVAPLENARHRLRLQASTFTMGATGYVESRIGEGVPINVCGREIEFRPDVESVRMIADTDPITRNNWEWPGHGVTMVGFYFEQDPDLLVFPDQQPGPEVVIRPGGEIGAGALDPWPIPPTGSYSIAQGLPVGEFRSHNGYRITWPRFMVERGLRGFEWTGLTAAGYATMRQFVIDHADTAVRWDGDLDAPSPRQMAVAIVSDPEWQHQPGTLTSGGFYGLKLQCVELMSQAGGSSASTVPILTT